MARSALWSLLAIPEVEDLMVLISDLQLLVFNFLCDLFVLILQPRLVDLMHIHLADHLLSQVQ